MALAGTIGLFTAVPSLDRAFSALGDGEPVANGRIARAADGQFYLDGRIGAAPVRFLIDPDSEWTLIAADDAAAAGLPAAGATTLEAVTFGSTRLTDIGVTVTANLPVSVLGRDALRRLGIGSVRGDPLSRP